MGLGTNLVLGFSGQFTLGQAGFMAIGAYSSAIITGMMPTYDGFYLSMVVGVIIAAVVALIFGIPTLRLKGDYLAIATLGMAEIIRIIIVNGGELTNGAAGLTGILPYTSWPVIYFFVVIITILVLNFLRSATGRQAITIREDEIAAESMGVNVTKLKVIIFVIGAMISAIAGSLYVSYIGTVVPKDFAIMKSIDYLIIDRSWRSWINYRYYHCCCCSWYYQHVPPKRFKPSYDYLRIGFDSCNALPSRWASWNKRTLSLKILQ